MGTYVPQSYQVYNVFINFILYVGIMSWAQNYNASLKLRPTLIKVTNFDSIFYR